MPRDTNQLAHKVLQIAIGEDVEPPKPDDGKDPAAVALGRKGGKARAKNLNKRQLILHLTEWNGFANYQDQLTSSEFWHTTGRTIAFTAVNVVLIMGGGTLVGLLLNRLGKKMRILLQASLMLAWAMPSTAE